MIRTDKILDIKGLISPRPEIVTEKTLTAMEAGQVLTVVTTCRTAAQRIPELCRALGCSLIEVRDKDNALVIQIQK